MAPLYQDECTLTRGTASKALIGQVRPQEYEEVEGELDLSSSSRTMPPPPSSGGSRRKQFETNNNTPPDHWPVSSSDDYQPHHRQAAFPFDVLNAKQHKKEEAATTSSSSSKPLFFYSINTMLPQQNEECWENNTNDDSDALDDVLDQALRTHHLGNNDNQESSSTTKKKKSILRRRSMKNLYTTSTSITIHNNKPRNKRTVTFSQDSLIVIHTIPSCTFSNIDMSTLYYTDEEIRTFKKEYKQEKKNERIREYSYWKAKVLNRWYLGSSSNSSSSRRRNSDTSTTCINGDDDLVDCTNIDWSCTMSSNDEKDIPVTLSVPPACITIPSSHGLSSNSNAPSHWIQCTSLYP